MTPQDYITHGWALCAIPANSKAPRGSGWQQAGAAAAECTANMGVVHGLSGTCAIDIDDMACARDALAAVAVDLDALLAAPDAVQISSGRENRAKLLYAAPAGWPNKRHALTWPDTGCVLELRAGATQDVLPPSVHPDTGAPYEWIGDWRALPELPDALAKIWREWGLAKEAMQAACPWAKAQPARVPQGVTARTYSPPAGGGDVIGTFNRAYSPGDSLVANGYRAAGTRWMAPDSSTGIPGVVRLPDSDRIYSHHGSDPLSDGFSHDAFSVYCQVECNGNVSAAVATAADMLGLETPPLSAEDQRIVDGVMGRVAPSNVIDIKAKAPKEPVKETPPDPGPIPVNMLKTAEQWLKDQVHSYKHDAVRQVVLSFAGATTARRYVTRQGQPTTTFFGVCDSSVAGMRPMKGAILGLTKAIGDRHSMRGGKLSSDYLVYRALLRCPRLYWITDEYGYAVQTARKQQNGAQESALAVLHDCYTGSTLYIDPDTAVSGNKERRWDECDIYHPTVTMMSLLSHDHLSALAQRSEYGRGTLQQTLMVIPSEDAKLSDGHRPEIPAALIEHAKSVRSVPGIAGAEQTATMPPQMTTVSEGDNVHEIYEHARARMIRYMDTPERQAWRGMVHGYMQSVRRMACSLAAWDEPERPCVTAEIAGWCGLWAERCLMQIVPRLEVTALDHDGPDVFQRVLEVLFTRGKNMTAREIAKTCRPFQSLTQAERDELLTRMADDGYVIATKTSQSIKYMAAKQ